MASSAHAVPACDALLIFRHPASQALKPADVHADTHTSIRGLGGLMIRYTIKLRMGARLGLLLLFLMAIGMVGIYGIERANDGAERQYREDVLALGGLGRLPGVLDDREDMLRALAAQELAAESWHGQAL